MDVFAHVCESLRADDLSRLRKYPADGSARARFSTWLVTVVHHLAIDWYRHRDGRPQAQPPVTLTTRQQEIYRLVFLEHHGHEEAYQLISQRSVSALPPRTFGADLRLAQRAYNVSGLYPRAHLVQLSEAIRDSGPAGEDAFRTEEARSRLDEAMATLRPEEKLALKLFVVEGMPAAEVAGVVGWPDAKSVYNRVYRLLKTLRRRLLSRGIRSGDL